MPEIFVDLQGLNQVYRTLNTIRHDLDDFDADYVRSHAEAMGHRRVIAAFDDFVYGWSDGRERIDQQLEVATTKIEAAVDSYTQAEQTIGGMADQMRGGAQ